MTLRPVPSPGPQGTASELLRHREASDPVKERLAAGSESAPEAHRSRAAYDQIALGDPRQLVQLKARLTEADLELAKLRLAYTDTSEPVERVRATVRDLRDRIEQESTRNADNELSLFSLQSDLELARVRKQELELKAEEIQLFLEMNPSQMNHREEIEPAIAPSESQWKKSVFIAVLGSLAGLFLGVALAGASELMDQRLQDPRTAERELGLRVVGVVPTLSAEELRRAFETR